MSETGAGILLIALGVLSMLGAVLNWRIVSHSGKLLNLLLGDKPARVIYFAVGMFVMFLGVGKLIGANWFGM